MSHANRVLLAGDIGGTKTALAVYSSDRGAHDPLIQATYASKEFSSLEAIVADFLGGKNLAVARASIDVAGPVVNGQVQVTNLPWVVDARVLSQMLGGVPIDLLNDLQAIANSIPFLQAADLETLNVGVPEKGGTLAVIAPGTGLGEAFLVWDGQCYRPIPSEGGHTDFGPTTPLEFDLLSYLQTQYEHVSYERICSGMGLPNLYTFFKEVRRLEEPSWLREELAAASDLTPIIVQAAVDQRAEICIETLNLFVSILGHEASNLAMKTLAVGGVYIGGGIPLRILAQLRQDRFMQAFTHKGRFSELLARVPVHVILNPQAALLGSACFGLKLAADP